MKGKAIIQLFDKDGKEIYKQEHKNIITNSYNKLFNPNFPIDISGYYNFRLGTLTPMYKKIFGGIMLFSDNIDANSDNFMITKKQYYDFVGNAGSAYAGNSIYRGSFNETESFIDEENKKITMVWDFPSNAANGKVKCIGLCPRFLGDSGLIKDINDTSVTSLICGYGSDFEIPYIEDDKNTHSFLGHNFTELGTYLYSKDLNTNVYIRQSGTNLYFTEVKRNINLSLTDEIITSTGKMIVDGENLYKTTTYTCITPKSIQSYTDVEYELGYIYCTYYVRYDDRVEITLYKINADTYQLESSNVYTFYIAGLTNHTLNCKYINGKIYITSNSNDFLYICDTTDLSFKSIEIGDPNNKHIASRFFDTVIITRQSRTKDVNPCFILDDNDNLYRNNIREDDYYSSDNNRRPFIKIFTNDEIYNYPIGIFTKQTHYDYEQQNQIVLPHLSSINNVDEFVKYPSNTMKITYVLSEY